MENLYKPKEKSNYFSWNREDLILFFLNYSNTKNIIAKNTLEIGCAKGNLGAYFKEKYNVTNYIGVDLFESAIKEAKDADSTKFPLFDDCETPVQVNKKGIIFY